MSATKINLGVGVFCAAPTIFFNVLPHVATALDATTAYERIIEAALAAIYLITAIAAPWLIFGMANAKHLVTQIFGCVLAVMLFGINLDNGIDMFTKRHENESAAATGTKDTNRDVGDLLSRKKTALEALPRVPDRIIESALTLPRKVLMDAENARDMECSTGRGPLCNLREKDATSALAVLAPLETQLSKSNDARVLEKEIAELTQQKRNLANVATNADATAETIAAATMLSAAVITKARPIYKAIGIELLDLLGPFFLIMGLTKRKEKEAPVLAPVEIETPTTFVGATKRLAIVATNRLADHVEPTPAKAKAKAVKKKVRELKNDPRPFVMAWLDSATIIQHDARLKGEVFREACALHAEANDAPKDVVKTIRNATAFGKIAADLGIQVTGKGRTYYHGRVLKPEFRTIQGSTRQSNGRVSNFNQTSVVSEALI